MTSSPQWRIALADVVLGDEERDALEEVLRSGWLSMGPRTAAFEQAFAKLLGVPDAVAVTNGTAALHLAAAALGIAAGNEVIVPALTFVASAAGMRHAGATVRLADSTSVDDFAIDPAEIDRLAGPATKAVVVVHYGGSPADMRSVHEAAARHGLLVIEDAAHAVGGTYDGRACGTLGDAGCFSFFANKNMTTAEGGMLVLADENAAANARRLRSHAMTAMTWDRHRGHASGYDVVDLGFNYRIDELRAALGSVQLARLPHLNAIRTELAERYRARLGDCDEVRTPSFGGRGVSTHHLAVVVCANQRLRDAVRERLTTERIQTSMHYPAIHSFTGYGASGEVLPVAEEIAARALTLPLHPKLSLGDVDLICDVVLDVAGGS